MRPMIHLFGCVLVLAALGACKDKDSILANRSDEYYPSNVPALYCYRTLAQSDCYQLPLPGIGSVAGTTPAGTRLVGYFGPRPGEVRHDAGATALPILVPQAATPVPPATPTPLAPPQ